MNIQRAFYGLQETEITFTPDEVKEALIEYMISHNKSYLPDKVTSCEIYICEEYENEKAKVILTINSKKLEKKE